MHEEELRDALVKSNLLSPEDFEKALNQTKKLKRPLERVILDMHLLDREPLFKALAKKIGVEYRPLAGLEVGQEIINVYSEDLARHTRSVPLSIKDGVMNIAMEDPTNISLIDQVQLFTNYPIEVYLSSNEEIETAINQIYTPQETQNIFTELAEITKEDGKALSETSSIVKIVDLVVAQAVRDRASDIHIEPEDDIVRIRFRIDGVLHEIPSPPKEWEAAIISRIKVLSSMDIAESRIPQDGHFQAKVDEKVIDFRVSTLPTIHGENVVMRLLDTASVTIGLEQMGFTTHEDLKKFEELIARPYGIILSTGPTGCGKTTTLYSALMRINTPDRNIITLEDPVEYRLGLIRQVEVNSRTGMTFAAGLRAILRQDPDIIMVGEIRDLETARLAIQSALTGHLVFSTLHTNDSASAVIRLMDMGVEQFLVSASLVGVMAQRLVRNICPKCKEPYQPKASTLKKWGLEGRDDLIVYRGRGCHECKGTGYKGRTGIYELMAVTDEIKEMVNKGVSTVELRKKAEEQGTRLLWEDGREKVLRGITTFEEVARVCEEQVEIKPVKTEVNPNVNIKIQTDTKVKPAIKPKQIDVNKDALNDYQSRITRWLSGK